MNRVALVHGLLYVTSGLWPVVHLKSFEAVTGRKRDRWLVRTTGALIAAIGSALVVGAFEGRRNRTVKTLGIASAATLGGASVYFTARGDVPPIYLGDAVMEAALIGAWVAG